MKYDEFKEIGSEAAVKAAGKNRQEGKNYQVCDGDIVFFRVSLFFPSCLAVKLIQISRQTQLDWNKDKCFFCWVMK